MARAPAPPAPACATPAARSCACAGDGAARSRRRPRPKAHWPASRSRTVLAAEVGAQRRHVAFQPQQAAVRRVRRIATAVPLAAAASAPPPDPTTSAGLPSASKRLGLLHQQVEVRRRCGRTRERRSRRASAAPTVCASGSGSPCHHDEVARARRPAAAAASSRPAARASRRSNSPSSVATSRSPSAAATGLLQHRLQAPGPVRAAA